MLCFHPLSENKVSAAHIYSSICQFLIYSTFVLVSSETPYQGHPRSSTEFETSSDVWYVDMSAWNELFVPAPALRSLQELQFTSPTPIQALSLPSAIRDRLDIVGAAETVRYS